MSDGTPINIQVDYNTDEVHKIIVETFQSVKDQIEDIDERLKEIPRTPDRELSEVYYDLCKLKLDYIQMVHGFQLFAHNQVVLRGGI